MIRRLLKHPRAGIAVAIYLVLWGLTALIGNSRIDEEFDKQNRYGSMRRSDGQVEITRIRMLYVRDLSDPRNTGLIPANGLFRYRSPGIAVAPFVVVDEIGTIFAPLGGIGCVRVSFWFFCTPKTWIVHSYWNV